MGNCWLPPCLSPHVNGVTNACPPGPGQSDEFTQVKHLEQCPAHSKCLINTSNYYHRRYPFPF